MRVFIVHAHHEPKSFNGAMTREATAALVAGGHDVEVSDLYAMGFNPVSDRRNFATVRNPDYLRQQVEETYASEQEGFAAEIKAEMDKLFWCDVLIFQFPLWWFGLPAILKGWVDRVFAMGRIYGGGRWYDHGVFAGKRAMCSVTIGSPAPMYSECGLNGPISSILFPINHGIFYFTGFAVVQPFLVHAPARLSDNERAVYLVRYRERVLALQSAPTVSYPKLADYDEQRVLRSASDRPRAGFKKYIVRPEDIASGAEWAAEFSLCQGIDFQSCRKCLLHLSSLLPQAGGETEGRSDRRKDCFSSCAPLRCAQAFGRKERTLSPPLRQTESRCPDTNRNFMHFFAACDAHI